jgi:hypothetical protein
MRPVRSVNKDPSVFSERSDELIARNAPRRVAARRELREQNADNDQADHTVGPPSRFPEINNRLRRTSEVSGYPTLVLAY